MVLARMAAREEDRRLESLETILRSGEKLTAEQRDELRTLKRQRHERNKKRTAIYTSR